ncbi:DUF47 family protein [Sphingomonas jatrophae]|uniref:Nudix hydrolase domain-containing protein n=1 Tax=Sphingomonas jatrophae TaxID=1166337 RepID=A0A1I6JS78_9SPHN|nr:DUF47 family protein [Sphingomonas jatrophae]SFR81839.1 hypothetical protein SAMN05192580_0771 [Sphingomonas jatrophae]
MLIRQIAALPYRSIDPLPGGVVQVMLVTSRGTKRWVIPKGNQPAGLAPHAAAGMEAEEEAGVCGPVCPTPLGSFRYRKRRGSGASLMVDVDVFPLAVTREMPTWKEQHERERRWFTLAEAAEAVDEPDLRAMIRSFSASGFRAAAKRTAISNVMRHTGVASMFGWFQRLLPRTGNFFDLFEAHSQTVLAAANALARVLDEGSAQAEHIREVIEREQDADNITRDVLLDVRKTFLTPFDRGAITSLIGALDDAVDEMHAAANAISIYEVRSFAPEMRDLAGIVIDAARLTAEAMPLLREVARNGGRLHELTERVVRLEGQADEIQAAGLKKSFLQHGAADSMRFTVEREIYKHLESVVNAFEDVANEIDGIVIDHA